MLTNEQIILYGHIDSGRRAARTLVPSTDDLDQRAHWLLGFIEGIEREIIDLIAAGDDETLIEYMIAAGNDGPMPNTPEARC